MFENFPQILQIFYQKIIQSIFRDFIQRVFWFFFQGFLEKFEISSFTHSEFLYCYSSKASFEKKNSLIDSQEIPPGMCPESYERITPSLHSFLHPAVFQDKHLEIPKKNPPEILSEIIPIIHLRSSTQIISRTF